MPSDPFAGGAAIPSFSVSPFASVHASGTNTVALRRTDTLFGWQVGAKSFSKLATEPPRKAAKRKWPFGEKVTEPRPPISPGTYSHGAPALMLKHPCEGRCASLPLVGSSLNADRPTSRAFRATVSPSAENAASLPAAPLTSWQPLGGGVPPSSSRQSV